MLLVGFGFCIVVYLQYTKDAPQKTEQEIREGLGKFGVRGLHNDLDRFKSTSDVAQRIKTAIRLWENNTCDPVPILMYAVIDNVNDENVLRMGLSFSDEDSDIVGFGIREESRNEAAKEPIIEEIYPVFVHSSPPSVWISLFPIQERTVGKRKDENLWKHYPESSTADVRPPIIVSVPDPNNVDVWIWLYDQAGNKSEKIKAFNKAEALAQLKENKTE